MSRARAWTAAAVVAVCLAGTTYGDVRAVDYLKTRPDSTSTSTWPRTIPPSDAFNHAGVTIVKAARNDPSDLSFRVTFPATPDRESYLFVDCDSGTYSTEGDESVSGRCLGRVNGSIGAGGRPHPYTLTVRVSEPQKRPWGVAYYR